MNLKVSNFKKLNNEELKAINAGTLPDCEPGQLVVYNGLEWVCVNQVSCRWELPTDAEDTPGDNSGHGW